VDDHIRTTEYEITGDKLLAKVRELAHEANVRRLIIKDESGRTLIEIPLTLGAIGALLLPVWAALGAIAALVARLTIIVEKVEE
jgi:hypothetical protein